MADLIMSVRLFTLNQEYVYNYIGDGMRSCMYSNPGAK